MTIKRWDQISLQTTFYVNSNHMNSAVSQEARYINVENQLSANYKWTSVEQNAKG